ncbi:phage recombination protein Bet [Undibacterium sp. SXout7W]|uniref:phage recombination protein Bet n=1 Tax=Undibacterium sp. SXout7W TaxID=3413049 RepID=UPI003BEFA6C3
MSNLIVAQASKLATQFDIPESGDLVAVLKATAFKGQVSDAQMSALLIVANQYGLNPWTKEIYAFPDQNNGIVPVVGVDGWSRIINSNAQFDGMDFEQDDESCTCIIYRKDRNHPIRVTEYLSECKRAVKPWQSHPKRMLRHKAMIQCARLAFGYVGIYDQDEAERIVEKDITPTALAGVDIDPLLNAALATKTDAEALQFWRDNNAQLAKYPDAHKKLKEAIVTHRARLAEEANKTVDVPAKEVTQQPAHSDDDFLAAMDAHEGVAQ